MTQSGNLSSTATWGGSAPPGIGDTFEGDGFDLTVDVDTTVGTSPDDDTTYVGTMNGNVTVAAGKTFTVRGNMRCRNTAHRYDGLGLFILEDGANLVFDLSHASSPPAAYKFDFWHTDSNGLYTLKTEGISGTRCSISAIGGRVTAGGDNGTGFGGSIDLNYTDVTRVTFVGTVAFGTAFGWYADNTVFLDCACTPGIDASANGDLNDCTFDVDSSVIISGTGEHSVTGCVFICHMRIRLQNAVAFNNNYFFDGFEDVAAAVKTVELHDCFYRVQSPVPNDPIASTVVQQDWTDVHFAIDGCTYAGDGTYSAEGLVHNPHWCDVALAGTGEHLITRITFEDWGTEDDDGDVFYPNNADGAWPKMTYCIGISRTQTNPGVMITDNGNTNQHAVFEHNTWMTAQFGAIVLGESTNGFYHSIASYQDNILWRYASASVYKVGDVGGNFINDDVIVVADYNVAHNILSTGGQGGNGYDNPFTESTPGVHDLAVDPQFIDPDRRFWTWVQSIEASWSAGSVFPSNANPTMNDFQAHGLFKLSLKNQTYHPDYDARYTLAALQVYIRAGFAPTNPAIQNAGHDGITPGAVEGIFTTNVGGISIGYGSVYSPPAQKSEPNGVGIGCGSLAGSTAVIATTTAFMVGMGSPTSPAATLQASTGLSTGLGSARGPAAQKSEASGAGTGLGSLAGSAAFIAAATAVSTGLGTGFAPTTNDLTVSVAGFSLGCGTATGPAATTRASAPTVSGYGSPASPVSIVASSAAVVAGLGSTSSPVAAGMASAATATGLGTAYAPATSPPVPPPVVDYPDPTDVRLGVIYADGTLTGTLVLPAESVVLIGQEYGADGEFVGTFSPGGAGATSGPSGLMNHRAYVLEFTLDAEPNMDAKRTYRRRTKADGTGKEILACRVSDLGSSELLLHSMRGSEITHRVYFVTNPNLREENRLEINGLQYILLGVPTNPSQAGRLWQLNVKALTQQNEFAKILE